MLWPAESITHRVDHAGVQLHVRCMGQGPPLLLLHGHPQSHAMWHRVAPRLALHYRLVMMDLRGYGDSDRPAASPDHSKHSKRVMANDALCVMHVLGHPRFGVLAHDRGARVAHRLAADHPDAVSSMLLLDIAPTLAMYRNTSEAFAQAYWHWFFLIQPTALPEALIDGDPVQYLRACMGSRRADGLAVFDPSALAEYERCIQIDGSARGICEDYRASAGIDLVHDQADVDSGIRIQMPVRVLWGADGAVGKNFDVLGLWRDRAKFVSGQAVPCSHYIAEELPDTVVHEALEFFKTNK